MKNAHDTLDLPIQKFEKPDLIKRNQICSVTKKKPLPACPIEKEIYKVGTEPTQICKIHRTF